ncbi:hypothetical protein [Roseobacter sp. HKCCA0434]|uniref:hypothetical protein n=1 Tax=Roseobacter sp. HKCCA0434 TaxID=3079297 RepID=UPI002905AFCC|nr:hypothetical protein [Roseobacter sp. HKCCA0434]
MKNRVEPGLGPKPSDPRPVAVTVERGRMGGNRLVFWLATAALVLADVAILAVLVPILLRIGLAPAPELTDLGPAMAWLLALIAANLTFGIPALLARPR